MPAVLCCHRVRRAGSGGEGIGRPVPRCWTGQATSDGQQLGVPPQRGGRIDRSPGLLPSKTCGATSANTLAVLAAGVMLDVSPDQPPPGLSCRRRRRRWG